MTNTVLPEVPPSTTILDGVTLAPYSSTNPVAVSDSNLAQLLCGTGGMANGTTHTLSINDSSGGVMKALVVHPARINAPLITGQTSQISLVAGSQIILANGIETHGWILQNISSNPQYITFGSTTAITASAVNGFLLAAGSFISSYQLFGTIWQGVVSACPTTAGDKINVFFA